MSSTKEARSLGRSRTNDVKPGEGGGGGGDVTLTKPKDYLTYRLFNYSHSNRIFIYVARG